MYEEEFAEELAAKRRLLKEHTRRFRKLQERQARIGKLRQPDLDIDIEDVEEIIKQLREQLSIPEVTFSPINTEKLIVLLEKFIVLLHTLAEASMVFAQNEKLLSENDDVMSQGMVSVGGVIEQMVATDIRHSEQMSRLLTECDELRLLTKDLANEVKRQLLTIMELTKSVHLLMKIANKSMTEKIDTSDA